MDIRSRGSCRRHNSIGRSFHRCRACFSMGVPFLYWLMWGSRLAAKLKHMSGSIQQNSGTDKTQELLRLKRLPGSGAIAQEESGREKYLKQKKERLSLNGGPLFLLAAQPAPPLKNRRCLFSVQTRSVFWQGSRKMIARGKGEKQKKNGKNRVFDVFLPFFWWEEVDSNYRSRRRQIYSLIHLATLESSRI